MPDMTERRAAARALGMDAEITRRDFLGSTLLASGAMLLDGLTPSQLLVAKEDWTGFGGIGEYASSNGNTLDVLLAGHKIRDRAFDPCHPTSSTPAKPSIA